MIEFENVTITYPDAARPAVQNVNLHVPEGEFALVVGRTGSGKSTLLRAVNGLVPHFTGGTLQGTVTVAGRDTRTNPPRELADVVGIVAQDPMSSFVTDSVEEELAYGMESLGIGPQTMRRRVEETLDLLGLTDLRSRPLLSLSGGQRQRAAIGAVLTANPAILVLDEPTSALDPGAAEEVLAALQRLVFDLGLTVLLSEHRLERVIQYADRLIMLVGDGTVRHGDPAELMRTAPVAPPVVEVGRQMGWNPLPLSVRDARRESAPWRRLLEPRESAGLTRTRAGHAADRSAELGASRAEGETVLKASNVIVRYAAVTALAGTSLELRRGEVAALMGRNGAGKSTLMAALIGMRKPDAGRVGVGADLADPAGLRGAGLLGRIGLVPQEAGDMLYADSVRRECADADRDAGAGPGTSEALLAELAPGIDPGTHPRDLSEGQRLCLVLAVVLASRPPVILLDEPTRGLDYPGKARFSAILRRLAAEGHAILMATHDVELVAEAATRVVIIADGELVADGPTREVVVSSPIFAPQVAKMMRPTPALTAADAVSLMRGVTSGRVPVQGRRA